MGIDVLRGRPDPVIVLGMHRSGTSAISKLLHRAEVNMGFRQESNAESFFFLRMNRWMLTQFGVSWATPESLEPISDQQAHKLAAMIDRRLRSPAALEHFGPTPRSAPWGFKDPRTTLLFDVYNRVFPRAKIIIASRHGVDVAESLRVRATNAAHTSSRDRATPLLGTRQPGAHRLQAPLLTSDLERNFALWVEYQKRLVVIADTVESDRLVRVRFEDLVADPETVTESLSALVHQPIAAIPMRPSRAYAHRSSAELAEFAAAKSDELSRFGY